MSSILAPPKRAVSLPAAPRRDNMDFYSRRDGLNKELARFAKDVSEVSTISKDQIATYTEAVKQDYEDATDKDNIYFHNADGYAEGLCKEMSDTKRGLAALERIKHSWIALNALETMNAGLM